MLPFLAFPIDPYITNNKHIISSSCIFHTLTIVLRGIPEGNEDRHLLYDIIDGSKNNKDET